MKHLPTSFALAGLAALSLGLPAHHPARATAGLSAAPARAHVAAALPVQFTGVAAAPKPAEKTVPRGDGAEAAEGLMVGPDGVIYRREAWAR